MEESRIEIEGRLERRRREEPELARLVLCLGERENERRERSGDEDREHAVYVWGGKGM